MREVIKTTVSHQGSHFSDIKRIENANHFVLLLLQHHRAAQQDTEKYGGWVGGEEEHQERERDL